MIKFKYALNSLKEIIHINSLERDKLSKNEKFVCISCENELIPRLGKERQKHFAHKKELNCSGETYLHNLAKLLFYQEYNKCLNENIPFFIELFQIRTCIGKLKEFGIRCSLKENLVKHDLTEYYRKIELEKKDDKFRPDVMLLNNNEKDKIYIEIAVTHFSEDKKIESGFRLIEISVNEENDLEPIRNHSLSSKHLNISFLNFIKKEDIRDHCKNNCQNKFDFFTVEHTGRCLLQNKNLSQISNYLKSPKFEIINWDISKTWNDPGSKYKYLVAKFYNIDQRVRNCFICRYHAINDFFEDDRSPIFCKFLKIKGTSNLSIDCKYFKAEKKYIDEHLKGGESIINYTTKCMSTTNDNSDDEDV